MFILLVFKMNSIKKCHTEYKPYIHIALFLLCETTLGLMLIIGRKLLTFFQTDIPSLIAYNLFMLMVISYITMNIFNHLQLIYWDIYEVNVQSTFHFTIRIKIKLFSLCMHSNIEREKNEKTKGKLEMLELYL